MLLTFYWTGRKNSKYRQMIEWIHIYGDTQIKIEIEVELEIER